MSVFNTLRISGSALTAERLRMDVIANNVANSQTTRTAEGGPYQRQQVVFSPQSSGGPGAFAAALRGEFNPSTGVRVAALVTDSRPGRTMYDPTHPDADEEGFVEMPNVDLVTELVDMMSARRAYQANTTVIQATKDMARSALEIGR